MIVQFAIEPASLRDVVNHGRWASFVDDMQRFWPSHGMLILPSDFDDAISRIDLDPHRLSEWKKLVAHDGHRKRPMATSDSVDWNKIVTWNDLQPYNAEFELALVQDFTASKLKLKGSDVACVHDPDSHVTIEITKPEDPNQCSPDG